MSKFDIIFRDIEEKDLLEYEKLVAPEKKYRKFNGPYFAQPTKEDISKQIDNYREKLNRKEFPILENKKLIINSENDEIIGEVNWYWKSEETNWMELGIVIFNEDYWGRGIGKIALSKWITEKFNQNKDLVRLGVTTWSGNIAMQKLAEKLNLKKEAVYRKARIVNGQYFDSVSYGTLREEWFEK